MSEDLKDTYIDEFRFHEILDRTSMVQKIFEDYVCEVPATRITPAIREKAEKISLELAELYQLIGRVRFDEKLFP